MTDVSNRRVPVTIRALLAGLCIVAPLGAQTITVGSATAAAAGCLCRLTVPAGVDTATFIPFALIAEQGPAGRWRS